MSQLVDKFGRQVTYLRMSVTDRCDFRCVYCMAEDMQFLPRQRILTLEELYTLGASFVKLGVEKLRITGGEPLVRSNIISLVQRLGRLPGLRELVLTTNGSQLTKFSRPLKDAGVSRLNISLDSLRPDRFLAITRTGKLDQVLTGIDAARDAGFSAIKINSVIMKGRNDDEILDLLQFVLDRGLDISFIEEMPLGHVTGHDRAEAFCSSDEVRSVISQRYELVRSTSSTQGPSRYWSIPGYESRVGFISPHSHNFCDTCNRVRLTVDGRLLLCLGNDHAVNLKEVLRHYPGDQQRLEDTIQQAMTIKPERHEFTTDGDVKIVRFMNTTGG